MFSWGLRFFVAAALLSSTAFAQSEMSTEPKQRSSSTRTTQESIGHEEGVPFGRYLAGGIVSSAVGYGIGHAVQGRWTSIGWAFSLGQGLGLVAMISSKDIGTVLLGAGTVIGFRIWEIIDSWTGMERQENGRYIESRVSLGISPVLLATQNQKSAGIQFTLGF